MTSTSLLTRAGCLATFALAAATPALADANFHAYSSSTAYVADLALMDPDDPLAFIVSGWAPFQTSSLGFGQGLTTAYSSNSGDFDGRYLESTASASLIDGTLKGYAYAAAYPSEHGYMGRAAGYSSLGDRFVIGASSAGAFNWTPESQGHFTIALDGFSFTNAADTQLIFQIGLSITSVDGTRTAGGNVTGFLTATGLQTASSWVSPANTMPLDLSWRRDEGYNGDYRITVDFNPGGDFDWTLSLTTVATVNNDFETSYSDYSHTARLSYWGPEGSTTYSASGEFPGTLPGSPSAVPEPGSALMTLAGLSLLGWLARRRARA